MLLHDIKAILESVWRVHSLDFGIVIADCDVFLHNKEETIRRKAGTEVVLFIDNLRDFLREGD